MPPTHFNPNEPAAARYYAVWLGGGAQKDSFQVDRDAAQKIAQTYPGIVTFARENRAFLGRAVTYLANAGIRQFIDVGVGLPAPGASHEVAQSIEPSSVIVGVDNDKMVLAHGRALLDSHPLGLARYIPGDVREPDLFMNDPDLLQMINLEKPVGILLVAVMHLVMNDEQPYEHVRALIRYAAPGSYVVMSHGTFDFMDEKMAENLSQTNTELGVPFQPRTFDEITKFFDGLELVEPGVVPVSEWHATTELVPAEVSCYAAVARIP